MVFINYFKIQETKVKKKLPISFVCNHLKIETKGRIGQKRG